ncbi:hypothetical protein VTK56DRAFT_4974 [Thermocarpiscus australiensis]
MDMIPPPTDVTDHISLLDDTHADAFKQALTRLFQSDVAELTYAEIVDGLPTEASFLEFHFREEGNPVFELQHTALCPGVLEKTRRFRETFDPTSLVFSTQLLLAFQQTTCGTKEFHLRLIELLAVACHQIGIHLFNLDDGVHKRSVYEKWRDMPRDPALPPDESWCAPTAFYHNDYLYDDQYPNGIADIVGYWAEAKKFGGVVVFDRGESGSECREVFLHGSLIDGPSTIYPPTRDQFDALIRFLLDTDTGEHFECPLPTHATSANRWRWDPYDAMRYNIFRDRWERRVEEGDQPIRARCVQSECNWPELRDKQWILLQSSPGLRDESATEADIEAVWERMKTQITPSSPLWRTLNGS